MVRCHGLLSAGVEDEPKTHIGVTGIDADGAGDGQERGLLVQGRVVADEAEFLGGFTLSRVRRVFVDFDVSARW